ncbi:MAG: bifunctional phosphoglucose/phosphomannose isomerase [Chitinophagales bacterium]|jgi:glucose/mannose-6-phosphate isomerase|nr:bifunctional phosphoglucose/phosphomannose isomerase [Chitinophagales bacterium]
MMKQLIAEFPEQLAHAIAIGKAAQLSSAKQPIHNVLVTGLGGSGMGGNVVVDVLGSELALPLLVNKDYHLPAWVSQHTLVIACSYSGNTEETITALQEALTRQATIVCVSTGGKMLDIARKNNLDYITLPAGRPPRASLAYSFVQQFYILHHFGLIGKAFEADLESCVTFITQENPALSAEAESLATHLYLRLPIIYAPSGYESVAIRWRQQFNENSKMLCWHHVLPEMNHNELVGWRSAESFWAPIFLEIPGIEPRTAARLQLTADVTAQYCPNIFKIHAKGDSVLQKALYLIQLGDWLSYYMAELRQFDAVEVKVIDYLKAELGKL